MIFVEFFNFDLNMPGAIWKCVAKRRENTSKGSFQNYSPFFNLDMYTWVITQVHCPSIVENSTLGQPAPAMQFPLVTRTKLQKIKIWS